MKKIAAVIAACLLLISLSGCLKTAEDSEIMSSLTETEETETDSVTGGEASDTLSDNSGAISDQALTADQTAANRIFTLYIPAKIKDMIEVRAAEGGQSKALYKAGSAEGTGKLFSVALYDDDYSFLPSYDVIGKLISEDGSEYTVLAVYPTDVQYMPEDEEEYRYLESFAEGILRSFTPGEGYTFEPSFVFDNMPDYMK